MSKITLCTPNGVRVKDFKTYYEAVTYGQQHFGHGKFLVDTGTRIPTREEQLLQDRESKTHKSFRLETLLRNL